MSVPQLSPNAQVLFTVINKVAADNDIPFFNAAEARLVKDCVLKYAMPKEWGDRLTWFVDRVINAVKSLFGQSDWQKTMQALKQGLDAQGVEKVIRKLTKDAPNDIKTNFTLAARGAFTDVTDTVLEGALAFCVRVQENANQLTQENADGVLRMMGAVRA